MLDMRAATTRRTTHLRQLLRRLILIQHTHLIRERIANNQPQRNQRRSQQQIIRRVQFRSQTNQPRVYARRNETVCEDQEDPF